MDRFNVATLTLGILGFGTGVASLTWNVVAFLLQGARPKLKPIIGFLSAGGLITNDATRDIRESLVHAATQFGSGPLIFGVKVINAGRATFHVAGWSIRAEPSGVSLNSFDVPPGGTAVPHDITAGGDVMFITDLEPVHRFASTAEKVEGRPQRIVLTVSSGGRTFKSKPIANVNLALGRT